MSEQKYSELELKAMRKEYAPNATDDQWILFMSQCERRNLVPGRHVIFGTRKVSTFDKATQAWVDEQKVTLITTVEAMRLIAERTGKFKGQRPIVWHYSDANDESGTKFITSKIPLGRISHAASVEILRSDWDEPGFGVARYEACVQRKKPKTGESIGQPNSVWEKRGEEMTGKCAVADCLRKTFVEECGDLWIKEELNDATVPEQTTASPAALEVIPVPVMLATPQVNNEAAAIVADERPADVPETPVPVAVPVVTEQAITNMHKAAAQLDVPNDNFDGLRREPVAPAEPEGIESMFAPLEDEAPVAPAPAPVQPAPVAPLPPRPPAPVAAPAAPVAAPAKAENPDDVPPGLTSAAYKAFTGRCTTIVRDVMTKAGEKNGSPLLKAYLFTKSGAKNFDGITTGQWKVLLDGLEKAGSPAKTLALIKAK